MAMRPDPSNNLPKNLPKFEVPTCVGTAGFS